MPTITILPHTEYCPEGRQISAPVIPSRALQRRASTRMADRMLASNPKGREA